MNDSELLTIGKNAFYKTGIEKIIIPKNVTIFGSSSFAECNHLQSIVILEGENLCEIEKGAFSKSGIRSIYLPSKISKIGE